MKDYDIAKLNNLKVAQVEEIQALKDQLWSKELIINKKVAEEKMLNEKISASNNLNENLLNKVDKLRK